MSSVITDMSMSLDGFIVGSDGDHLHDWVFNGPVETVISGATFHFASASSARIFKAFVERAGAAVLGKQSYISIQEQAPFQLPSFVLTHHPQLSIVKDGTTITFVTDGIESAIMQARIAAGEKDVYVFGGADTIQQCLRAGLLDEIQIDLIPVLLGSGLRLFDHLGTNGIALERTHVAPSPGVTHLSFRVIK